MSADNHVMQPDHRITLRLEVAAEFSAVRAAIAQVRGWLAEKNLPETELSDWELALVEAANNAVKYATAGARKLPVVIEVSAGERDVEVRVTDHTNGFDWPAEIKLPAAEAESGRGLYLMKSLTDNLFYLRHPAQNVLVLRRRRPAGPGVLPEVGDLQPLQLGAGCALGLEGIFRPAAARFDPGCRGRWGGAAAGGRRRQKTGDAAGIA